MGCLVSEDRQIYEQRNSLYLYDWLCQLSLIVQTILNVLRFIIMTCFTYFNLFFFLLTIFCHNSIRVTIFSSLI